MEVIILIVALLGWTVDLKREKKIYSRGWFRSIDLWVMGPARSHCATLLCAEVLLLFSYFNESHEDDAICELQSG